MEGTSAPHTRRLNYRYVIIALCFLMVMTSLGFASSPQSLFPDEIAKELGVERSLVSFFESFRYIATSVVNLFFGLLIAKFGPKKLVVAGFASLTTSIFLFSVANNLLTLYLAGILLGVGFSWTTTTMVGYVVPIWTEPKNRGTIMGAILASNGLGAAIAIPIVGSLIDPDVTGTYRNAYRLIAVILLVVLIILLIFFRDKPRDMDTLPAHAKKSAKGRGKDWEGLPFSRAVRTFPFWGILISIFLSGMILQGIAGIAVMHMKDVGLDYGAIKVIISFGSLLLAVSKFSTGFLYDRLGLRFTATVCMCAAVIAAIALSLVNASSYALAIIYIVISRFAFPLETIMLPLYASDLFGKQDFAKVLGIFVSVNTAGYAVGAPILNACYDVVGSYAPALFVFSGLMVGNLILIQFIISKCHRTRNAPIEAPIEAPEKAPIEQQ